MVKVLSLFDGMACGYLAFDSAGLKINQYDAFEIDEHAVKLSSYNCPDIVHHGDVFEGDFSQFEGYDYLIGGSPCTYWSIAQSKDKRETTPSGLGWDLFSQYLRALDQARPHYFIYENNASMSPAIKKQITKCFGFAPVLINSALVSAQNRERLYWVGKRNAGGGYSPVMIEQPQDRGILLKDVLDGVALADKSHAVIGSIGRTTPREYFFKNQGELTAYPISDTNGKARTIKANYYKAGQISYIGVGIGGRMQTGVAHLVNRAVPSDKAKNVYSVEGGTLIYKGRRCPVRLPDGDYEIRKLSVSECKRLQTVPEGYDMSVISNSQAYKCLGNGWTVEVIAHLIRATTSTEKKGQTSLDSF